MDLVRDILIKTADADGSVPLKKLVDENRSMELVGYHVEMMAEHGLIDADVMRGGHGTVINGTINKLTWDGQDYLGAIESDAVWEKTKEAVGSTVKHTTFEIFREVAVAIGKSMIAARLGLPLS